MPLAPFTHHAARIHTLCRSRILQTLFYFSYMLTFCLALGIMCGTLGYTGCAIFVRRIYRNIKSD